MTPEQLTWTDEQCAKHHGVSPKVLQMLHIHEKQK